MIVCYAFDSDALTATTLLHDTLDTFRIIILSSIALLITTTTMYKQSAYVLVPLKYANENVINTTSFD